MVCTRLIQQLYRHNDIDQFSKTFSMHYMTLKSAIAKYGGLKKEGKNDEEILAAIKLDEKKFSDEDAQTILDGLNDSHDTESKGVEIKGIVIKEFRDKDDFSKLHKVGSDVSSFDKQRLTTLKALGLID